MATDHRGVIAKPTPRPKRTRARVTPDTRQRVIERDMAGSLDGNPCVAPRLGAKDDCADQWGRPIWVLEERSITLDHVREQPMMGKRAPSDMAHLVSVCWHHHLDGWATAHRPELRAYLASVA